MFSFQRAVNPWIKVLQEIPLFSTLNPRELVSIESLLHERRYEQDEIVFDQGEEGLGLYVIIKGRIAINRNSSSGSKNLATLGPGTFFGELALLDGAPRSAEARAMESTTLIGFFRPDFMHLLETNRSIGAKVSFQLARHLGHRLRDSSNAAVNPTN